MTILAGADGLVIDRLALVLIDAVLPFGVSHLLVKFFRLAVLIDYLPSLLVENGKDHRVTTPAQRGRLDVVRKPRSDAHRVFHRQSRKLIVRSVHCVGGIKLEFAGKTFRRSESFLSDSMTRVARDAVARQRAVLAVRVVRQSENHAVFERLIPVQLHLALAHDTVTAITGVVEEFSARRIKRFFGFELGMKDRIAARQAHHRCAPLSVRREIDRLLIRFAKRIQHVVVRG